MKEKIIELSSYAVEIRYPDIEATDEEAQDSLQVVLKVKEIVSRYFRMEN